MPALRIVCPADKAAAVKKAARVPLDEHKGYKRDGKAAVVLFNPLVPRLKVKWIQGAIEDAGGEVFLGGGDVPGLTRPKAKATTQEPDDADIPG